MLIQNWWLLVTFFRHTKLMFVASHLNWRFVLLTMYAICKTRVAFHRRKPIPSLAHASASRVSYYACIGVRCFMHTPFARLVQIILNWRQEQYMFYRRLSCSSISRIKIAIISLYDRVTISMYVLYYVLKILIYTH